MKDCRKVCYDLKFNKIKAFRNLETKFSSYGYQIQQDFSS